MNINLKYFTKLFTWPMVVVFLFQNIAISAPQNNTVLGTRNYEIKPLIFIPEQYGTIEQSIDHVPQTIDTSKSPSVILVKDTHCNYEAQTNISKILEILIRDYKIDLICVEGAEGLVDTSIFSSYPDQKTREDVTNKYLKKGYLTASEALSIAKAKSLPFTIYGVEDTKLYLENFKEFRNTIGNLGETKRYIELVSNLISNLKQKYITQNYLDLTKRQLIMQKIN